MCLFSVASLYPLELVKTRMQVIRDGADSYRSMGRAFEMVVKREGFTGLYQGVGPALFAASGSWGGYFFFYEESKNRKMGSGSKLTTVDHVSMCYTSHSLFPYSAYAVSASGVAAIWSRGWGHTGVHVQPYLGGKDSARPAGG